VLFAVDSKTKSYPVYLKDSILNTNPEFDYGLFVQLSGTVTKSSTSISTFSFVFSQAGIYVFADSVQSSKITIIGVVAENQECSNKDTNVQSATA
jgi:hypothetical protein